MCISFWGWVYIVSVLFVWFGIWWLSYKSFWRVELFLGVEVALVGGDRPVLS